MPTSSAPTRSAWHILVIENDPGDAFLLQELLAEVDPTLRLTVARSVAEVLDRGLLPDSDCVLLDISGEVGLDALRAVLGDDPDAAVCVLTGPDDEHLGIAALAEGAQDNVVKGRADGEVLVRAIRYSVERRRAERLSRARAVVHEPPPAPATAPRDGVFLCYRRADTAHPAGRLYDRLADRFGEDNVFMDVDSLAPGSTFEDDIAHFVARSALMLVVVGPGWLDAADRSGARRLHDRQDPVRTEIELAAAQDVPVVAVLVDDATMPTRADLPPALLVLTRRTSLHLAHRTFRRDADAVAAFVATFVATQRGH